MALQLELAENDVQVRHLFLNAYGTHQELWHQLSGVRHVPTSVSKYLQHRLHLQPRPLQLMCESHR